MAPVQALAVQNEKMENEEHIISILFEQDELTWQNIIMELIKTEKMDPWDINVSLIAEKFIELLAEMKKMDFRISGKIIVAAAFFLKIKSDKLLKEDIAMLDALIQPVEDAEDILELLDNIPDEFGINATGKPQLKFKTPQPRKRKVSVYDLIRSLEKALESEQKRSIRKFIPAKKIRLPEKQKDITLVITELFEKIKETLERVKVVWFYQLIPSDNKMDKINTFVPLLYLDTQRKIDLEQAEHFGDIKICLAKLSKEYT